MDRKEEVIIIFFKTGTNIIQRSYSYVKLCQRTCNLQINCVSSNNEVLLEKTFRSMLYAWQGLDVQGEKKCMESFI